MEIVTILKSILESIPHSVISDDQMERAKWRWVFLRLNKDYEKKCSGMKEKISGQLPTNNEFGLRVWIDPTLEFNEPYELIHSEISNLNLNNIDIDQATRLIVIHNLGGPYSKAVIAITPSSPLGPQNPERSITVTLNLSAPDNEIIEQIQEVLHKHRSTIAKDRTFKKLKNYHRAVYLKYKEKKITYGNS